MDPKSFTKTSFCNSKVDNITENTSKKYILDQMSILCSDIKYNDRYAKIYNDKFSNNLNNIHLLSLKSMGNPYLLFITQISSLNYAFLIDKKIKDGYSYPKIFILPYHFKSDIFKNHSLFECELIRTKQNKWILSLGDVYYLDGKNMKKTIIMDRMNQINTFIESNLLESDFNSICQIQIKKYFDYCDYQYLMDEFIPQLSYSIRGFYLVPVKVEYSKILYLFLRNQNANQEKSVSHTKNNTKNNTKNKVVKENHAKKKDYSVFRLLKTLKPDVYELYQQDDDSLQKKGIALVQTIELSHKLSEYCRSSGEIYVKCRFDRDFKKWEPFERTTESPSTVQDL